MLSISVEPKLLELTIDFSITANTRLSFPITPTSESHSEAISLLLSSYAYVGWERLDAPKIVPAVITPFKKNDGLVRIMNPSSIFP